MENHAEEPQPLILDELAVSYLKETSKWTKFMAILGFVFIGLAIIIGLIFTAVNTVGGRRSFISVIPMVLMAGLYFLPIYYLLKFSTLSRRAIEEQDSFALTQALQYQKMHYRYVGILMIILCVIYALVGIFAVIFLHNGFGSAQ